MMRGTNWLSAHIYDARPWEEVLVEIVKPLLERLVSTGLVRRYFFIRYWDRGPHVRVRLDGGALDLCTVMRPTVDTCLEEMSRTSGSGMSIEYAGRGRASSNPVSTPQYRAAYELYVPEVERYGGPIGIDIAEQQFYVSSGTVLKWITARDRWTYETALGAALQLHVSFALALGMSVDEARDFYGRIANDWLAWSARGSNPSQPQFSDGWRGEMIRTFDRGFEHGATAVVEQCSKIWSSFTSGLEPEDEWIADWLDGMRLVATRLNLALEQGQLDVCNREGARMTAQRTEHLWPILASYVHMTNNRLGILNRDEAYVAYLISRGMSSGE